MCALLNITIYVTNIQFKKWTHINILLKQIIIQLALDLDNHKIVFIDKNKSDCFKRFK